MASILPRFQTTVATARIVHPHSCDPFPHPMRLFVIALLITLPWLNPFSPGPSAAAVPLLFAWACAASLLLAKASEGATTTRQDWVRAMASAWLLAAGVSAVIGLLQYFGASGWLGVWVNNTNAGEAYGNLRQRNQFASLMNIGLVALVWWVTQVGSKDGRRQFGLIAVAVALAVLLAAGNAASGSRTGLFQLLLVVALSFYWLGRASRQPDSSPTGRALPWVLLAAVLAYALATWALPWLLGLNPMQSSALGRLSSGNSVCASRLTLWHNVLVLIGEKPWLGWGWGELDYAHFITLYPGARFCDILDNAHNLPLQLAVELGVPMSVMLCGGGLWLVWRARPWQELDGTRHMAWAVLAVILLHSLLEYPLWYGPFQMAAGLCVWLLIPEKFLENRSWVAHLQALVAGMLLTFCALAGWQYHVASQLYLSPEQRDPAYRSNTLEKTREVLLFQDQVQFAELTTTDLTLANAAQMNRLAKQVLHFSPEARVTEIVIDSALLLGHDTEARYFQARYKAAFPQAYAEWFKRRANQ